MKPSLLIPLLTLAVNFPAQAQSPNSSPPPGPPQGPGKIQRHGWDLSNDRREHFRKMAEQFRQHRSSGSEAHQPGNPQEREMHIGNAMKELRAAGLGPMAERMEQMLKRMKDSGGPGHSAAGQARKSQPQGPGGPAQVFGLPTPPAPNAPALPGLRGQRPETRSNDELRAQVQRLTHQVEELQKSIHSRPGEGQSGPHADGHGSKGGHEGQPDSNRGQLPGGEHHMGRPDSKGDKPQGKSNAGDQQHKPRAHGGPPQRPHGDGPSPENRDTPPGPKRGAAEEIKPAELPQSGSIE